MMILQDARTAIARAAAVFILHASTYAQECALSNKRKTVTAMDVLNAIRVLECEELEKTVKEAVEVWKTNRQQRNEDAKKRRCERAQNAEPSAVEVLENVSQNSETPVLGGANAGSSISEEPQAKKMLLDVAMEPGNEV
ncbi:unnamed protein product [Gongylonema pulchrum]|uniref:DNA polymerase epsilon subunit 3 n=1 Tax=Gongylonema pulchrum TaxID=637853 RepID=A0A183EQK3_9BILA|nr:unnamed protein product [Gongylonema pulchrum]